MSLARQAYVVLAWLLLACVIVQIFLAGLGTFVSGEHFAKHAMFIHFFELLPLVLFGLAFTARLRGASRWLPLVAFGLMGLQYATAEMRPSMLAAFHPVNAMLIAWVALRMTSVASEEPLREAR